MGVKVEQWEEGSRGSRIAVSIRPGQNKQWAFEERYTRKLVAMAEVIPGKLIAQTSPES